MEAWLKTAKKTQQSNRSIKSFDFWGNRWQCYNWRQTSSASRSRHFWRFFGGKHPIHMKKLRNTLQRPSCFGFLPAWANFAASPAICPLFWICPPFWILRPAFIPCFLAPSSWPFIIIFLSVDKLFLPAIPALHHPLPAPFTGAVIGWPRLGGSLFIRRSPRNVACVLPPFRLMFFPIIFALAWKPQCRGRQRWHREEAVPSNEKTKDRRRMSWTGRGGTRPSDIALLYAAHKSY